MEKVEKAIRNLQSLLRSGYHLSVGYSGGKDSTVCVVLLIEAMKRMIESGESVPQSYVTTSNTRREMPAMDVYLEGALNNLRVYCAKNELPLEVKVVEPNLSGRFTWTTIGRGKLPRYPGTSRDCARDEKIYPQQRLAKLLEKETGGKIISVIGSRFEESSQRESNMTRWSMDELTIVTVDNTRTYSVIADWYLDEVWDLIIGVSARNGNEPRYFATFQNDFAELSKLYRDANEGVCGVVIGNSGNRSGCGSRFGCAYCVQIGDRDKSLESLIEEDPILYGYMEGLVAFRKYLMAIRWDMNSRDFRGRNVNPLTNHMKVTPDYLKPEVKRDLLRFLLTIDKKEEERAAEWERLWHEGKIEHTEENKLLKYPMFQFISFSDIIAIDFAWSLSRDFAFEAAPAARDWIDVYDRGVRYEIPNIKPHERKAIPATRWFDVSEPIRNIEGLKGLIPDNSMWKELEVKHSSRLEVEDGAGWSYIRMIRENYYKLYEIDTTEVCRVILHHGWIRMPSHEVSRYDKIARRNDYLYKLMKEKKPMKENPFNGEDQMMTINDYLLEHSISDKDHLKLLDELEIKKIENDEQMDLLGAASIIEMRAYKEDHKKRSRCSQKNVDTESIEQYYDAGLQEALF